MDDRLSVSRRAFLTASVAMAAWQPSLCAATPEDARSRWIELLGPFPDRIPDLDPVVEEHDPFGDIARYHVRFRCAEDDWITAWLLVPPGDVTDPRSAVLCPHSTTQGAGKDRIIGLCGATHGDPPDPPETSRAYGLDLAQAGYITLCPDLLCDGERVPDGLKPYNSNAFYEEHPDWSMVGKNTWDMMRCVDFLLTRDEVDPNRIACLGHSLGGHTSLFAAAFDSRIAAAVSNGGMLSWVRDTDHWSRPPDASGSPVRSYIYIPQFRPYIDNPDTEIPVHFHDLMAMVAPRPLLIMAAESEYARDDLNSQLTIARKAFPRDDRITAFTYPGGHNFPPVAKRFSIAWLDRWMGSNIPG